MADIQFNITTAAEEQAFDPHAYTVTIKREVLEGERVFHGRVAELPDLEAFEPTYEEAYDFLMDGIRTSKAAFTEQGRAFPQPLPQQPTEYSGRVTIRMPKWLHARLDVEAQTDGTSLNQYMVALLASSPRTTVQQPAVVQPNFAAAMQRARAAFVRTVGSTRILAPVTATEEDMEPLKGSVVHGIQNVTYHPSRPTIRTSFAEVWGETETRRKPNVVIRKRR